MSTITLKLARELATTFPALCSGGFVASGLFGVAHDDLVEQVGMSVIGSAITTHLKGHDIASIPVVREWREAIKLCGLKPSSVRGSVEQLVRRYLAGSTSFTGLPIVDAYCAVSAKHLAPLGAYDLARLPEAGVELRACRPASDEFTPLAGELSRMPMLDTVVVYASHNTVLCYAFNHRDSVKTCLTHNTDGALFLSEAITPEQHAMMCAGLEELRSALRAAGANVGPCCFVSQSSPTTLFRLADAPNR